MMDSPRGFVRRRIGNLMVFLALIGVCSAGGCTAVGVGMDKLAIHKVDAAYSGLAHQTCGIMVWADKGLLLDHPTMELDVAKGLQTKLKEAADSGQGKEVEGIKWVDADRIAQFQENHPEIDGEPAEKIAPRLGVTRLIYIEISSFDTHPKDSVELYRGAAKAIVRVLAVSDRVAKTDYQNDSVSVLYPPKVPPDGVPDLDENTVEHGTIDALTTELAKMFFTHDLDESDTQNVGNE